MTPRTDTCTHAHTHTHTALTVDIKHLLPHTLPPGIALTGLFRRSTSVRQSLEDYSEGASPSSPNTGG
eukprot:12926743-Prorocentrum_lima.AAC.1